MFIEMPCITIPLGIHAIPPLCNTKKPKVRYEGGYLTPSLARQDIESRRENAKRRFNQSGHACMREVRARVIILMEPLLNIAPDTIFHVVNEVEVHDLSMIDCKKASTLILSTS